MSDRSQVIMSIPFLPSSLDRSSCQLSQAGFYPIPKDLPGQTDTDSSPTFSAALSFSANIYYLEGNATAQFISAWRFRVTDLRYVSVAIHARTGCQPQGGC